jgi:hypothetical protein
MPPKAEFVSLHQEICMFLEECGHVDYKGTKMIYEIARATRDTFVNIT